MAETSKFQCSFCSKSFGSKQNLSRHGNTHRLERKHICTICAKRFTRSDLLRRHIRLHESDPASTLPPQTSDRLDTLVMPQPPSTAELSSSLHEPGAHFLEWPTWDHADLLSCDQVPEDILQDAASWQSFLHSDSTFSLSTWDTIDASQVGDHAATTDGAHEVILTSETRSPPNEISCEDQTPFAWDPTSRRISHVGEVVFGPGDPLLSDVEPRFILSLERYMRLRSVLGQDIITNDTTVIGGMPTVPCIEVLNAFLAHFVRYFLPQAPVLHCPTFDINGSCHDHLLMIMIAIGAVYCRRRHARRFGIVLQDLARCHLHMAITANDVMLKDPDTIYSSALVCYAGIWNGNKRAFELAEALRGNVVAWARRLSTPTPMPVGSHDGNEAVWLSWVRGESLRRLRWTVYAFDCQISSLMNTAPSMSLGEVFDWDCPCDDEYWAATTARQCKLLLGNAVVPPSKSFAAALSPFILESPRLRPLRQLNDFGAFLVLLSINMRIFRYTEERDMHAKLHQVALDDSEPASVSDISLTHDIGQAEQLAKSLALWEQTYGRTSQADLHRGSFFRAASQVMIDYSRLQMQTSISDLQDIIGKSGQSGIGEARSRFTSCFAANVDMTHELISSSIRSVAQTHRALVAIDRRPLCPREALPWTVSTLSPYSPIYTFLTYVFLYACATAMTVQQKEQLYASLSGELAPEALHLNLEPILTSVCGNNNDVAGKEILRSAAQTLRLSEYWGCSTNLALLLHWRSRID